MASKTATTQDFPSLENVALKQKKKKKKSAQAMWAQKQPDSHLQTAELLVILCVAQWAGREEARRWKESKNESERGRMAELNYLFCSEVVTPVNPRLLLACHITAMQMACQSAFPPLSYVFYCWKTNEEIQHLLWPFCCDSNSLWREIGNYRGWRALLFPI